MKRMPDVWLRLASLALAAGLWFVIAGRQTAERGLSVPVELRNVPHDLEITGDALNAIEVRVRAAPALIDTLDPGRVVATIDLADATEGEKIVRLTPAQVRMPSGFRVVKITPSLLVLRLERMSRRTIPVRPKVVGQPARGFELAEVESDPRQAQIAGPKSRVDAVESAFTEPVQIEAATATVQKWVAVGLADPLLRLEGEGRARVTARIREEQQTRTFRGLEVTTQGGAAQVAPARGELVVAGPVSQMRGLDASAFRLYVVVPAHGPLPGRLPIAVEVASGHPGVAVVETRPAEVAVAPSRHTEAAAAK